METLCTVQSSLIPRYEGLLTYNVPVTNCSPSPEIENKTGQKLAMRCGGSMLGDVVAHIRRCGGSFFDVVAHTVIGDVEAHR